MADVNKEVKLINVNNEINSAVDNLNSENTTVLLSSNEGGAEIENINSSKSEVIEFHNSVSETIANNTVIENTEDYQDITVENVISPVQEKCVREEVKSVANNTSNLKSEPFIKLQFRNAEAYEEFSEILLTLLTTMGFTFKEEKLNFCIDFFETQFINSNPDLDKLKISKKKKRKRKKSKDEGDGFFVLDTTPSLTTQREKVLKYESKFNIQNVTEKNGENASDSTLCTSAANCCFNCNEHHNLKDCPLPRDNAKINNARLKFRSISKNGRYHLEDDQKYSHLKPGQLTENLRKALGLHRDQLPSYIYRMRRLGYPPGWLEEAQIVHSDLTVYDFDGKNVITNKKRKPFVDPEKIVDYPGFNVSLGKGFTDEYREFGVPPYSEKFNKEVMLQHIKKLEEKEQDNLDTEDMEFETIMPEDFSPLKCVAGGLIEKEVDSPSLTELESKKNQLLAELNDNTNGSITSGITVEEISSEDNKMATSKTEELTCERNVKKTMSSASVSENGKVKHIIQQTFEESTEHVSIGLIGTCAVSSVISLSQTETCSSSQTEASSSSQTETNSSSQTETSSSSQTETSSSSQTETSGSSQTETISSSQTESISSSQTETTNSSQTQTSLSSSEFMDTSSSCDINGSKIVKTTAFGTPILKTASPYSRLPNPENFSKNISDILNFENLPNSTGKYEQMTEVLQKVRRALKNLHEKNS